MADTILCPKCNHKIDVSDALSATLRAQLRIEFEAAAKRKESDLTARLAQEREQLLKDATLKAHEAVALDFQDVTSQLADAKKKLGLAQQAELQLRHERRQLEEDKNALALTVTRQLDEERAKIRVAAKHEADEEHRLKEADKDSLVSDLRKQIAELKRKSEQGVPQVQGEVMEVQLEEVLRQHFPADSIEPVPVGKHGGDVLQRVIDSTGQECGVILWEAKRTKAWNDQWLPKLRDDQRSSKAHVAVLTSIEMPKNVASFSCIDGVWVTNRCCMIGLATALRIGLLEVGRAQRTMVGKQTKAELLYNYLCSTEFSNRVAGIVEAFVTLKRDLDSEKRSMHRIWNKREKHLDRGVFNASNFYGDLGGILGANLPELRQLELAAISADTNGEVDKAPWE